MMKMSSARDGFVHGTEKHGDVSNRPISRWFYPSPISKVEAVCRVVFEGFLMKALIASVFRARRVSGAAFVCVLSLLALGLSAAPGQTQTFTISRNNAVQSEGNGGTKTFSFNVTLTGAVAGQTYNVTADTQNGPADAGSAPFPVGYVASATGDPGFGTAPGSGWDFVQKTQTFSFSSNSTQQFTVAVNGDSSDEYDERFGAPRGGD